MMSFDLGLVPISSYFSSAGILFPLGKRLNLNVFLVWEFVPI